MRTSAHWHPWLARVGREDLSRKRFNANSLRRVGPERATVKSLRTDIFTLKAKRRAKYDDAYARQERAIEKGQQPIGGVMVPIQVELLQGLGPEEDPQV